MCTHSSGADGDLSSETRKTPLWSGLLKVAVESELHHAGIVLQDSSPPPSIA